MWCQETLKQVHDRQTFLAHNSNGNKQWFFTCTVWFQLCGDNIFVWILFFFLKFLMLPIADSWEKKSASRHEEAPGPKRCKLETHMNNTELIKGTKSC